MASQMDRETKDQYLVIIQAKDMVGQAGAFSATATVTINLSDMNDNPPKFIESEYKLLTVAEDFRKFRFTVALLSSMIGCLFLFLFLFPNKSMLCLQQTKNKDKKK